VSTPGVNAGSASENVIDLREFFHALGSFSPSRALTEAPAIRTECDVPVELIDTDPAEITAPPIEVEGFIDGVQAALCVTYRGHRPVYLTYVAAGVGSTDGRLLAVKERLELLHSQLDTEWVDTIASGIQAVELAETRPDELASAAISVLGGERETMERSLIEDIVDTRNANLVVDGSLVGRPVRRQLLGVVKTTMRRYLPDESVLWGLPAGWRSPRFVIPTGSQGVRAPRYSCYLRLHDASRQAWNFGLVRLETFDLDLLEPLAALALQERQPAGSHDRRYDRHLSGVRATEDLLRARRPTVFG
jgi:hypothetical protein